MTKTSRSFYDVIAQQTLRGQFRVADTISLSGHLLSNGRSVYFHQIEIAGIYPGKPGVEPNQAGLKVIEDLVSELSTLLDIDPICVGDSDQPFYYFVKDDVLDTALFRSINELTLTTSRDLREWAEQAREKLAVFKPAKPKWVTVIQEISRPDGGVTLASSRKDISTNEDWAIDEYYPNLKEGMDMQLRNFADSSNNLWLFYGLPGTGKSTLLRHICHAYGSPGYETSIAILNLGTFSVRPDLTALFNSLPDSGFLIIEDADGLIGKREDGNLFMTTLLNRLDGIIRSKLKIIMSTNLTNLKGVDEALLRPGRLYDATYFGKLNKEQVAKIAEKVPGANTSKQDCVLAELFGQPAVTGSIGFNR